MKELEYAWKGDGGFTVYVTRSRMSAEEREEFDRTIGSALPPAPRSF